MGKHKRTVKAAMAAMRAEWRSIREELERADDPAWTDDERSEALLQQTAVLQDFLARHPVAVEAMGGSAKFLNPAGLQGLEADRATLAAADQEVKQAQEESLQAVANLADAKRAGDEALLAGFEHFQGLTPADWAAMGEEQRAAAEKLFAQLQELRPEILADLPAERRRYWETR